MAGEFLRLLHLYVYTRRAISVVALLLWNSLPRDAFLALSLMAFGHRIKTSLFTYPVKVILTTTGFSYVMLWRVGMLLKIDLNIVICLFNVLSQLP